MEQEGRLVRQDQLGLATGGMLPLRPRPRRSPPGELMPPWRPSPVFPQLIPPGGCQGCDAVPRRYLQPQQ